MGRWRLRQARQHPIKRFAHRAHLCYDPMPHQRKGTPMAARTDFNSVQLSKPSTGISRQSSFLCLFILLIALPARAESGAQAEAWKAGTATTRITPDRPMWMAGYAARNKPSEGKVHDLHAKALALADSWGNRLVIVTLDLIGIDRLMRDWLRDQVARRYGLRTMCLVMSPPCEFCGKGAMVAPCAIRRCPAPSPLRWRSGSSRQCID